MNAFVDCDVILDLLTHREPHFKESALVFQHALEKKMILFTSPLAIANVHYMIRKVKNEEKTREAISKLLSFISIIEMNQETVIKALKSDMKDFEDAMQVNSFFPDICEWIITRNIKDYKKSFIPATTPFEINKLIQE